MVANKDEESEGAFDSLVVNVDTSKNKVFVMSMFFRGTTGDLRISATHYEMRNADYAWLRVDRQNLDYEYVTNEIVGGRKVGRGECNYRDPIPDGWRELIQ